MAFVINQVSEEKRAHGEWGTYNGGKFLVAHTSSNAFQQTLSRLQRPHLKKIEKNQISAKQSKQIMCESIARDLLLDWSDVQCADGSSVDYSFETAMQALMNDDDFRDWVQEFGTDLDNYRAEELEDLAK